MVLDGQYFNAILLDQYGVLELSCPTQVFGSSGPSVVPKVGTRRTDSDHGLNRKCHPWAEFKLSRRFVVMRDIWEVVKDFTDAVAYEFSNYAEPS